MRTWEENKTAINQLWPMVTFTDEERRLWSDDLAGLDQAILYDAVRETKRSRDTLYPQLKWFLDSYRELSAAKKKALRPSNVEHRERIKLSIDDAADARLADELVALIDVSTAADFSKVERFVLDKLPAMHSKTAVRVLVYARRRLLGEKATFGKVTEAGDVEPVGF